MPNTNSNTKIVQRPVIVADTPIVIDPLRFRSLFTTAERKAIESIQSKSTIALEDKIKISSLWAALLASPEISLNGFDVIGTINYLQSTGVISANRKMQILSNQVPG